MSETRWIRLEVDEETRSNLEKALKEAHVVHRWACEAAKAEFNRNLSLPRASELAKELTAVIRSFGDTRTQRAGLDYTVEQTLAWIHMKLMSSRVGGEIKIEFPEPKEIEEIDSISVIPRKIWQRTWNNYGILTTRYGDLKIQGDWEEVLLEESEKLNVPSQMFLTLCHRAIIRKSNDLDEAGNNIWEIIFLAHLPDSKNGKKRRKQFRNSKSRSAVVV